MAQIKGKFITLAGSLMHLYPQQRTEADKVILAKTGRHWHELEPEGWYDTTLFNLFMEAYAKASITGEKALVTLGRNVYPTIKKTVGFPPHLKTPLDFIKFDAASFLADHRGADVKPRRFIKAVEGEVIVQALSPGYNSRICEGVFLGILEMCGVTNGKVVQTKSQEKGDSTSEFRITW